MDQSNDQLPNKQVNEPASAWAELVVQNGRLSGARKAAIRWVRCIQRGD